MGSKATIAEREERKLLTIHHGAYVKVVNEVDPKDYMYFYTSASNRHIEDLIIDYHNLIRLIELADDKKKLTLIEKCICFMLSLKKNKSFHLKSEVKKGTKLSTINERMIVEAAMYFLICSIYKVNGAHNEVIADGRFDLTGFDNGHKRELNLYKKKLIELLSELRFDELAALEILNCIYLRGIMYKEDIDLDLEEKIKNKISCTELMENPIITDSLNPEFIGYKKKFRM